MKKFYDILLASGFLVITLVGPTHADSNLKSTLGINLEIVEQPDLVLIGKLQLIDESIAAKNRITGGRVLAGYPIENSLIELEEFISDDIALTILDDSDYSVPRTRCVNKEVYGIRFIKDDHIVDFVLGLPCQRVVWVFSAYSRIITWSGVLSAEASNEVKHLFK